MKATLEYLVIKQKMSRTDFNLKISSVIIPRFYNLYREYEMFLSYIPIQHIYSVYVYQAEALFEFLIIEVRIPDILRRSKKFNSKH